MKTRTEASTKLPLVRLNLFISFLSGQLSLSPKLEMWNDERVLREIPSLAPSVGGHSHKKSATSRAGDK